MKKKIKSWPAKYRETKEELDHVRAGNDCLRARVRELDEESRRGELEKQRIAALLIQERRELMARVDKLDILIGLTGGLEDGRSPSCMVMR